MENICCGYSLESLGETFLMSTHKDTTYVFMEKIKNGGAIQMSTHNMFLWRNNKKLSLNYKLHVAYV